MDVVEILKKSYKRKCIRYFLCCWKSLYVEGRTTACCDNTRKMMPNDTKNIVQQLYGFAPYCSYENFEKNGEDDFRFRYHK